MRKIFTTLKSVVAATVIAAMAFASSCSYDDTPLVNEMEQIKKDLAALTERVAALEAELPAQVDALTQLINGKVVVTDVETKDGVTTVTLSDGSSFTISEAAAGVDVTLNAKEENGVYYWAVFENGVFAEFLEIDGQKVPVFASEEGEANAELVFKVDEATGNLLVSIDGGANWVDSGIAAENAGACVFASVVLNEDGSVTFTMADGTSFNVAKADLVEFEAAKSALYVKFGQTKSIPFAINDAVEDINVMNQPLGWKASVEETTRAVGGMDYVLNITGPAKDFAKYAEKSGKVSIHFNTASGACKVMNVDVELAEITLDVDRQGNITITTTLVDEYDYTDWYGETEHIVEFNNFYLAVFDLDTYNELNGDLESVYNASWGEFNIPAAAGFINNVFANIGDNPYEGATYVDGVNEKWTINATVQSVLQNLDWYGQLPYEGNSFMVCVIPTDINANGAPVWSETIAVPFKQLAISIEENVDNRAFNNAYFNVTLRGGSAYYLYPVSKADIDMYIYEYEYYASAEEYFWAMLESYLQQPDWYSFGFKIESDVIEENIALSDLLAYTHDYYYFETKPATDYVMCLFVEEEGRTDYSIEDLRLYEFATADLVAADPAMDVTYEMADDWSLYTIGVDVTVPESVVTAYSRWYDEEKDSEALYADLIANGYAREAGDFAEGGYTYYLGTNCDAPATEKWLGLLLIDAQGNYTMHNLPFQSKDIVMNNVDFSIESVEFTPTAVTVNLAGLDGLEVKNYKYYFIATNGGSYYQKTEEECQDIAYSNDWLYKSTEAHPIIITSTADYKYSFSDGTYKLAVGLEFADGSFSKCVYGEYTYTQPAEELASVTAAYQENDPNYYALTLTTQAGDVITTTAGNGGVNYLNEGTWDFQLYYSSGFALGNTYMNGTQWVSDIKITVAYVDGKYDLTVNSSVGKYHYYGDIEGLVVPGYEGGDDSGDEGDDEGDDEIANFVFTSAAADVSYDYSDFYVNLAGDNGLAMTLNFYMICNANYIPEGTYAIGNVQGGCVFAPGFSNVTVDGVKHDLQGGNLVVAEVDGQYQFTITDGWYGPSNELKQFTASFTGAIDGMVVPSEYEVPSADGDVIELEPYDWFKSYGTWGVSNEFEIGWFHGDGYSIVLDFTVNPIVGGTYTLNNGLSGMYSKYRGNGMITCECVVTEAGDGKLTFDCVFSAMIEGTINAYHFTWTGDPSVL